MAKKININDIRKQAHELYKFKLLSKEYINNSSTLYWSDEVTGVKFTRSWAAIKNGQTSVGNPSKRLDIESIKEVALSEYGYKLLSDTYKNSHTPMKWLDINTNKVFMRSWSNMKSGFTGTYNLNDYESDKYFIENYEGLGYKLDMSKDEYLSSKNKQGVRLFRITNPINNFNRLITKSQFLHNAHSYLIRRGISTGEKLIEDILTANKIKFEREKSVVINGENHRFDFYIPDYSLFIEYDGQQHFYPVPIWGGEKALTNRIERDKLKNTYVGSNGYLLVRIPYIFNTYKEIARVLNEETTFRVSLEFTRSKESN